MNPFRIGKKSGKKSKKVDLVDLQGKNNTPVVVILPYGMFANASVNSAVGVLADQCNEAALYGIPFTVKADQIEELESGEIALGIPEELSRVLFKSGNKIVFRDSNNEGGDYMARFNELKAGFDELVDSFNNLASALDTVISGASIPEPGNGSPSAFQAALAASFAASAPIDSTASIDDAKIDDIEVPEL